MKPKELLHFLTDQIHHEPPMVSDHFKRTATAQSFQHDVIDTQEGFDAKGNYHRLQNYSESADLDRTAVAQLGNVSVNRGFFFDTDL